MNLFTFYCKLVCQVFIQCSCFAYLLSKFLTSLLVFKVHGGAAPTRLSPSSLVSLRMHDGFARLGILSYRGKWLSNS